MPTELLANETCVQLNKQIRPLPSEEVRLLLKQIPGWDLVNRDAGPVLTRQFKFVNFSSALRFTDLVGQLAEVQGHHPAILTEWGRVTVSWWTHIIHGLHRNDFIMAAKTDAVYIELNNL